MATVAHTFEHPNSASDGELLTGFSNRNIDLRVQTYQYTLSGGLFDVIPPTGLFEIPGLRTFFNGSFMSVVRLAATVVAPASTGTKLILQSSPDGLEWTGLAEIAIDTAGLHAGQAGEMPDGELQLRLVTSGGDSETHATIGVVTLRDGGGPG